MYPITRNVRGRQNTGTNRVDTGAEKIGGEFKSEGFEGAKPILARATMIWETIKGQ
jgi:hypothetical protein